MFGYNQSLQDMKPFRKSGLIYKNDTSLPIIIIITEVSSDNDRFYINDILIASIVAENVDVPMTIIVPPKSTYKFEGSFSKWFEYR